MDQDPRQAPRTFDTFHMGRSGMDLYSNDIGAAFVDIKSFAAYVGGSPTNMSVGCRRLGLNSALLTAFGEDPVGDFIAHFLNEEGVDIRFCPRKPGRNTSAVVLGIEPPDKFPLVFYRDNCADIALSIDDVLAAPIAREPGVSVRRNESEPGTEPERHPYCRGIAQGCRGNRRPRPRFPARSVARSPAPTERRSVPPFRTWRSSWAPRMRSTPRS